MHTLLPWVVLLTIAACSQSSSAPMPAPAPPVAPQTPATQAQAATAQAADPDEACGQIIVVAHHGAAHAADTIDRDKPAAQQRAKELLAQVQSGKDFAELATTASDAPSSAKRGGIMGTYKKSEWPDLHAALRDPLFALKVSETASAPVYADYGYVLLRRCAVEKAHSRHILVRYRGAKKSDNEIKRDKAAASARAQALLSQLQAGKDFADLAKTASDDSSAERGGDIGTLGRGLLALPYEQALFALTPGQLSGVVESEYGFHIIQRL